MSFWKPGEDRPSQVPSVGVGAAAGSGLEYDAVVSRESTMAVYNKDRRLPISEQRKRLPISKHRDSIMYAVESSDVVIIIGQTGSGKSTQLPQMILEGGWCVDGYRVLVIVPSSLSCVSVVVRVAHELGTRIGVGVGLMMSFESRLHSQRSQIVFATDDAVFRMMYEDPLLTKYSVVILDDIHVRTLNHDMLLNLMLKIQHQRPLLRIILASATVEAEELARYCEAAKCKIMDGRPKSNNGVVDNKRRNDRQGVTDDADFRKKSRALLDWKSKTQWKAVKLQYDKHRTETVLSGTSDWSVVILSIEGRQYPVDIYYTLEPVADYVQQSVTTAVQIHESHPLEGDILVFLTSQSETEAAIQLTKDQAPGGVIVPVGLHAGMSISQHLRSLAPVGRDQRKVIYSTSVAETGVTIPSVEFVVDCGFSRQDLSLDVKTSRSAVTVISRRSLDQRAGRAGRLKRGKCFRLFPEKLMSGIEVESVPEVCRACNKLPQGRVLFVPVCSLAFVHLLRLGIKNICAFFWLAAPPARHVKEALQELFVLRVVNAECRLVDSAFMELPVSPCEARLLILSCEDDYACSEEALMIVALLNVTSVFLSASNKQGRQRLLACRRSFAVKEGDLISLLNVWKQKMLYEEHEGDSDWCKRHMVDSGALYRALEIRNCLKKCLMKIIVSRDMANATSDESGVLNRQWAKARDAVSRSCQSDCEILLKCICAAFFTSAAQMVDCTTGVYRPVGSSSLRFVLGPTCFLQGVSSLPEWIVYCSARSPGGEPTKHEITGMSKIQWNWLPELAPDLYSRAR